MIAKGGSYIKKNGKLELVERTEEPKAADAVSGGETSPLQAEAVGAAASADPGEKPKQPVKPKGA